MACTRAAIGPARITSLISRRSSFDNSTRSSQVELVHKGGRHLFVAISRVGITNGGVRAKELRWTRRCASSNPNDGVFLPDLQVPRAWVAPEVAVQEAEWLRGALQQWLDDEFCPEPANEEISRRCAKVYYYCLSEEQLDVGDILMQMVRELETFSFKQSFHGAFSSANAAIDLITKRMRAREQASFN